MVRSPPTCGGGGGGAWDGGFWEGRGGGCRGGGLLHGEGESGRVAWLGGGSKRGDLGGAHPQGQALVHQAPFTSPCPPSNHTTMLIMLNKIPQISFLAAFVASFLSILDPNNNSDPGLGFKLGLGLGLGSPSWWKQSWFYNPF